MGGTARARLGSSATVSLRRHTNLRCCRRDSRLAVRRTQHLFQLLRPFGATLGVLHLGDVLP